MTSASGALGLVEVAENILQHLDKNRGEIPQNEVEELRNAIDGMNQVVEQEFEPLLQDLREAAKFQAKVNKACKDGEDVMSTGAMRDAMERTRTSRKEMCDWLLQAYPEDSPCQGTM